VVSGFAAAFFLCVCAGLLVVLGVLAAGEADAVARLLGCAVPPHAIRPMNAAIARTVLDIRPSGRGVRAPI
jgi:hypothetical protein